MPDTGDNQQQDTDQSGSRPAASDTGKTFTQDQVNAMLATERRNTENRFAGYDDIKAKADQFDKLTDEKKGELQVALDSAADFKAKYEAGQTTIDKLEKKLLRQKIAATEKLDPDLWDRVVGDTAEEITADAKSLAAKLIPAGTRSDPTSLRSGASATGGTTDKQRAAAALRNLRR